MIEIPWTRLDENVLVAVIEEFVLREGTEYGVADISLAQKVEQVREQLRGGRAIVVFDEATETTGIVPVQR